jgi:hypothetical protein
LKKRKDEDSDLLVYSMSDSATDILKKRKYKRFYSILIEKYLMDSEMKFREFFGVSRDILVHVCNLFSKKTI